eukprot:723509_1
MQIGIKRKTIEISDTITHKNTNWNRNTLCVKQQSLLCDGFILVAIVKANKSFDTVFLKTVLRTHPTQMMGNSGSQKRPNDWKSISETQNCKTKHKYRTRSPSSPISNGQIPHPLDLDKEASTHSKRTFTFNDIPQESVSSCSNSKQYSRRISTTNDTNTATKPPILSPSAEPVPSCIMSVSKQTETTETEKHSETETMDTTYTTDDEERSDIDNNEAILRIINDECQHETEDSETELAMPSLQENGITSPRLDALIVHAQSDHEQDNANHNTRRYRSKYSGHFKISLSSSSVSSSANCTHKPKANSITIKRKCNDDYYVYSMRKLARSKPSNSHYVEKRQKKKKKKQRKKRNRKRKSNGLMDHIRSRSHSLAHIGTKTPDKAAPIIRFGKCVANANESDHNGIVGVFLTEAFVFGLYKFWSERVAADRKRFGEIAQLFFSHLSVNIAAMDDGIHAMVRGVREPVRYLDMMGCLLRILANNEIDAAKTLRMIGCSHDVDISYFSAMLNALHDTFCALLDKEYGVSLRYMLDVVFLHSVRIMRGETMSDRWECLNGLRFLESLDECLFDEFGSQYLFHFLNQSYCKEISKFVLLYNKFKFCDPANEALKYKLCNKIYNECIADSCQYQINVAFATYQQIKCSLDKMNQSRSYVAFDHHIFDMAYNQIERLIQQNREVN